MNSYKILSVKFVPNFEHFGIVKMCAELCCIPEYLFEYFERFGFQKHVENNIAGNFCRLSGQRAVGYIFYDPCENSLSIVENRGNSFGGKVLFSVRCINNKPLGLVWQRKDKDMWITILKIVKEPE